MIYTTSSASVRRTFQLRFRDSSLTGNKGKRTYRLDVKPLSARTDDFNRANNETISTENLLWEKLRGSWQISSNRLLSNTSPSSYPLATIRTNTKKARVRIGQGSSNWGWGAAFWVIDQNNWFSVTTDQYTSSGSYSFYTCPNGGTLSGNTCLKTCTIPGRTEVSGGNCCRPPYQTLNCTPTYPSCTCFDTGGCPYDASTAPGCQGYDRFFHNCGCYIFSNAVDPSQGGLCPPGQHYHNGICWANFDIINYHVTPYTYHGNCVQITYPDTYYACNYEATLQTGSSTAHLHRLILRKSINGVITTIGTSPEINTSQNARPSYVNVLTLDNTVTISAPMDNGSGTLTMTYNASASDTRGIKFGVIFGETSGGSVASNVDNFEYEPVVV